MKRITVSLPGKLAGKVRRAAGRGRPVRACAARVLEEIEEREGLDGILADWQAETPVPDEVRQQAEAELDRAGLRN